LVERAFSRGDAEADARVAVERLALLAAAAALRQSAGPEVATLFARTRLQDGHGPIYGTSEISPDDARGLIDRALRSA
jgi:putative acyl-CoA dehydrogenase